VSSVQVIYLVLAALAANLPFMGQRILFVWSAKGESKAFGWRLLELLLLYALMLGVGVWLESRSAPVHAKQVLTFFVPTFALFLIAAFPGFVIRYFWRAPGV
jgi:hypothetical protein